jgi:hypothetical protein
MPAGPKEGVMSSPRHSYETGRRVDDYIDPLPDWQQATCRELRDLIHAADPEISETIKRTVQPYFVLEGNVCALLAAKDHVNLFLYDGGIVPDPEGIITAWPQKQDRPNDLLLPRRHDQRRGADRDAQADHRQQPRRGMAQARYARQRPLNRRRWTDREMTAGRAWPRSTARDDRSRRRSEHLPNRAGRAPYGFC